VNTCEVCRREFVVPYKENRRRMRSRRYCSIECYRRGQIKSVVVYRGDVPVLLLPDGSESLISPGDVDLILTRSWRLDSEGYVGGSKRVRLHRWLLRPGRGVLVDHRNGNTLDNRRENLRVATPSQNRANSLGQPTRRRGRFKGVRLVRTTATGAGRYSAAVNVDGRRVYLGTFDSEEAAARAYDTAARSLHGEFARPNFSGEAAR